jgi:hypothetical protein
MPPKINRDHSIGRRQDRKLKFPILTGRSKPVDEQDNIPLPLIGVVKPDSVDRN